MEYGALSEAELLFSIQRKVASAELNGKTVEIAADADGNLIFPAPQGKMNQLIVRFL